MNFKYVSDFFSVSNIENPFDGLKLLKFLFLRFFSLFWFSISILFFPLLSPIEFLICNKLIPLYLSIIPAFHVKLALFISSTISDKSSYLIKLANSLGSFLLFLFIFFPFFPFFSFFPSLLFFCKKFVFFSISFLNP